MSSEPDYNFNAPSAPANDSFPIHLPFALLSAAIAVVMVAQTVNVFKQRTALREGKAQLADAYRNREVQVKSSQEIQQKLQSIILDLLLLAKTDEDAKKIVTKYNIQQTGAAGGAAPESAPAATEPPK